MKPSKRIEELQDNDYRLDWSTKKVQAIVDYLDEVWGKEREDKLGNAIDDLAGVPLEER